MVSVEDFDRFVFVVGAPRCGTTSLAQFLKVHDTVSFPYVKEPHFFSQNDLRRLTYDQLRARVEGEYLRRFYQPGSPRRVGADASVTYFYTPEQLEPILRLWPNSRFVVALRDPLSMLPSLHRRLIYLGDETIADFGKAWAATTDRAAGRRIPRRCADPRWLRYDQAAKFSSYLERLYRTVGRERCQVVLFDDLRADPASQYGQFMEFLGLTPSGNPDLDPRRPGKSVRIRWLQRLLKRPPHAVGEYLAGEKYRHRMCGPDRENPPASSDAVLSLRKRLLRWNRVSRPLEPMSVELRNEICAHYSGEVQALGSMLGRDLSHWLGPTEGAMTSSSRPAYFTEPEERPRAAFSH